jgi:hypothetical protein
MSSGNNKDTSGPSHIILSPILRPSAPLWHRAPTAPLLPSMKPLKHSIIAGGMSSKCPAKKNVHTDILKKPPSSSEGATSNNVMVQASNLLSEKESKEEKQTKRMGPLTFDVNPKLEEDKYVYLATIGNQAKLICWHYRLGHLAFSKLKQQALNGEIPQRLAKVKPPACAGCLFSAITKVPWKGQETSSKVLVATKAGKCVSVDQMFLTQVGFIAQLKGTLTKKCYTAATIFVNHS